MNAEIESNALYFEPKKFSKKELIDIKKSVWKKTQDKVFINDENQDNLKYDPEYDDQECELKDFKGTCKIYFKRIKSNCSDLIILCNDQYVIYSRKTSDPVLDHINFCRRDQDNYLSGKPSDHAGIRNVFTDIYNNTK